MRTIGGALISIRKAASDLDRIAELLDAAKATYEHAIRSAGQYAIELNPADADLFRQHLEVIRQQVPNTADPEEWKTLEASFRGELRDFRDRSTEQLTQMRGDVKAAVDTMQIFAEAVNQTGEDHEVKMHSAIHQLKALTQSTSLGQMQEGVRAAANTIQESVQLMRKSHQLAVAQMRDEVRLLHKQIDVERRAVYLDRATGVWNRQKMDALIFRHMEGDKSFIILFICICNLRQMDQRYSQNVISGALKALLQRFTAMLGENAVLGRWSEDSFAAILEGDANSAMGISREANARLTGSYSVQEQGLSKSVNLHIASGIVERTQAVTAGMLEQKAQQMLQRLSGNGR
jgi:GGDEF domain-containing protein